MADDQDERPLWTDAELDAMTDAQHAHLSEAVRCIGIVRSINHLLGLENSGDPIERVSNMVAFADADEAAARNAAFEAKGEIIARLNEALGVVPLDADPYGVLVARLAELDTLRRQER